MPSRNTFLMHEEVVGYGDDACIFTAVSGTGKTTHLSLWLKNIDGSYFSTETSLLP